MTKLTINEFYNLVKNQAISTLIFYVNKFQEELTWDESDVFIPTYSKQDRMEQIAVLLDILEVEHNIIL
jgi:hypothetical protein